MEIVYKTLEEIVPYENNPRKNEKAVQAVANSIENFGFKVPIVIDDDGVIVAGHTRYKAAMLLGMEQVPCIVAADLSPKQIRAFRLADNKVGELASWDMARLGIELEMITSVEVDGLGLEMETEIDMEDFGFEMDPKPSKEEELDDDGYRGDERERTFDNLRMNEFDPERCAGPYQIPTLKKTDFIPDQLLGFKYMLSDNGESAKESGIHFFIDDYQFERIWKDPYKYMDKLKQYTCVLTPDFSLYMDMPIALKLYNVYRSRLIGQIMQDAGITVIPTLQYAESATFDFCFEGIEPGGVVATSTVGVMTDPEALKVWADGMDEAIRRLHPSTVVCYGPPIDYDWGTTKAKFIPLTPRRWGKAHEEWVDKRIKKGLEDDGKSWSK